MPGTHESVPQGPPSYEAQCELLSTMQAEQDSVLRQEGTYGRALGALKQFDKDRLGLLGFGSAELRMVVYYLLNDPQIQLLTIGVRVEGVVASDPVRRPIRTVNVPVAKAYGDIVFP